VKLLPNGLGKKLLQAAERRLEQSKAYLARLFDDMAKGATSISKTSSSSTAGCSTGGRRSRSRTLK
jgi:hypothetical protein